MSSVKVEIKGLGIGASTVLGRLKGVGRRDLIAAAGKEMQVAVTNHLRGLAGTRHESSQRLGAAPSNHLAHAAEKAAQPQALTVISAGVNSQAMLTIRHPGLSRAFHNVTITPKTSKFLTIPVHAMAYNRRAGELRGKMETFVVRQKGGGKKSVGMIAMKGEGKFVIPLYILVRSITQKQDRTLLPSDDELSEAASRGASQWLKMGMEQAGKL